MRTSSDLYGVAWKYVEMQTVFGNAICFPGSLKTYPLDEVIVRDVVQNPCPHISDLTIAGFNTPQEQQSEEMKRAIAQGRGCRRGLP